MIDRGGVSANIGTRLKESGQELIHHWNRLRSKTIQRATVDKHPRRLQGEIVDALHDGFLCSEPKTAETCRRLGRRPFDYIRTAIKAAFHNNPAPKLIPQN